MNSINLDSDVASIFGLVKVNSSDDFKSIVYGAIDRLKKGDAGAHWHPMIIEASRDIYQNDKPKYYQIRDQIKSAHSDSQITEWTKQTTKSGDDDFEASGKSAELTSIIKSSCELFRDSQGNTYASINKDQHNETWLIGSEGFTQWISYTAFHKLNSSLNPTAINTVINTLKGVALFAGEEKDVFKRCASINGELFIDLTNEDWSVVHISQNGWQIIKKPTIKFIRSNTAAPFPIPEKGNLSLLWKHINIPEEYRSLIIAFIIESWRTDTPYVILELCGEQGSAKSTTHSRIRQLSDPNRIPLRSAPKDVQDIYVSAANNHQASFENMSNLSSKMQDALCTLSTGGGYAARKLYSDSDETVIEVKRPIIINGIVPIATRSDLIDRIIHIDLPKLSDNYQSIRELDEAFKNDVPAIFGELLDITVKTLNALPSIKLSKPPRMADFAVLGEAVHIAMEINEPFIDVYNKNRGDSLRRSIESSPAAIAIQDLIRRDGSFYGTFKELKSELDSHLQRSSEGWPRSPKGLSEVLRRMGPALKETNILVEFLGHRNDGSYVSIKRVFESKDNDHNHHSVTESEFKNLFGDEVTEVTVANKVGQPKVLDYATAKDPG